jgi:hypothetical protein
MLIRHSVFLVVILVALGCGPAWATTYSVHPDGSGDFPTIQAAIDAAVGGDIIELADGTFVGEGNHDIRYRGKAITVRSQSGDPASCILDCGGSATEPHRGFLFDHEGPEAVLDGLTITGGYAELGGGIMIQTSMAIVRSCVLLNNGALQGGGVYTDGPGNPTFVGCTFSSNWATTGGGGMCI